MMGTAAVKRGEIWGQPRVQLRTRFGLVRSEVAPADGPDDGSSSGYEREE